MTTTPQLRRELIETGFTPIYNAESNTLVSYIGSRGRGPGGTSHHVCVDLERGEWSIGKLDQWGGTGARAPIAMSNEPVHEFDRDDFALLTARCCALLRRSKRGPLAWTPWDGYPREEQLASCS